MGRRPRPRLTSGIGERRGAVRREFRVLVLHPDTIACEHGVKDAVLRTKVPQVTTSQPPCRSYKRPPPPNPPTSRPATAPAPRTRRTHQHRRAASKSSDILRRENEPTEHTQNRVKRKNCRSARAVVLRCYPLARVHGDARRSVRSGGTACSVGERAECARRARACDTACRTRTRKSRRQQAHGSRGRERARARTHV